MTMGEKIYNCRKSLGDSQEAFAEKVGVSRQSVSKWETGEALPEVGKLLPIARYFHVTVDWLLDDTAVYPYTPPVPGTDPPPAPKGKTGEVFRKYGWIIGVVMIGYGFLLSIGVVPFFVGVRQALSEAADEVPGMLRAFMLVPVVVWIVAAALIIGGILFLASFRKKYRGKEK